MDKNLFKSLAVGAVAVAAAFGAWSLGKSSADNTTAQQVQTAAPAQAPQASAPQGQTGGPPPGFGDQVTGATAAKVEKAALAKYPGRIEVIVQLPDGSYDAHVITSSGEVHVAVSKDFKVTGADQGGPPQGGAAPASGRDA